MNPNSKEYSPLNHKDEFLACVADLIEICEEAYLAGVRQGKKLESNNSDIASVTLNSLGNKPIIFEKCERIAFVVADAVITDKKTKHGF